MREIMRHGPGRVFLAVLFVAVVAMLYIPKYFFDPHIYFGWMTLPFVAGVVFMLVLLVAYLIYFFRYWPYRD